MTSRFLSAVTILVPSYDEGLQFFIEVLGFVLIEDTVMSATKRWVLVAPSATAETRLLLAQAADDTQRAAIGSQAGGRVLMFLQTDNFARDYARLKASGCVKFMEPEPRVEAYGTVIVFQDPFGNKWDLIERAAAQQS
jgi:catechol 2,3-dioxygenase-like lactoylglutathione lyase family enzyme